jgi:pyrroline-5-carboxylate reductase
VRAVPNVCAAVGASVTGLAGGARATPADVSLARALFGAVGLAVDVEEALFDAFTAVAGCAPAFLFPVLEALADGAVLLGVARAPARRVAAQAMLGAARLALEGGRHPAQLKDAVCSAGGMTIAGVRVIEQRAVRAAFIDAVAAACEKARRIGDAGRQAIPK